MSFNTDWDVNIYKEEHESEDQWQLRSNFMIKWKDDYPEDRLVCLARVFINMEFMGCRYPTEVMHEVAGLSADIAKDYRTSRLTKLKRTFVLASNAAEDRARGVKRQGGIIVTTPPVKSNRINFIPADQTNQNNDDINEDDNEESVNKLLEKLETHTNVLSHVSEAVNADAEVNNGVNNSKELSYDKQNCIEELSEIECLNVELFNESMFQTDYGKFVLIIRPWTDIYNNILNSCISCKVLMVQHYEKNVYSFIMNGQMLSTGTNACKVKAKSDAAKIAWKILIRNSVSLLMKEQYIPQNETLISMGDMSQKHEFGSPIEDSVALKMMKLMGWKGGGLGADNQGIAEPIKPNLRMVNRAGLGHGSDSSLQQLRRAGLTLLRRRGSTLDADLVFTSEFSPEERAVLHECARQCGLHSKSYGRKGASDRFLVISNKIQPFPLVRAVVQRGGETPKYRVFIPATLANKSQL